jgi:outer membrane receptor protein involved in Fe transport
MKPGILTNVLLVSVCAAALATPAFAQSAAPADATATQAKTTTADATTDAAPAPDIVVTGSRVITNGNAAPTPLTITTAQDLQQRAPSSIPDALNQLPQFAGSGSPTRNSYNLPGSIQTGNNLNLRNLGPARVLTLGSVRQHRPGRFKPYPPDARLPR